MKNSSLSFAIFSLFVASFALPLSALKAGDVDSKTVTLSAAQSSKQKHQKICLARYRDCVRAGQIPSFECQYIYQDCSQRMI